MRLPMPPDGAAPRRKTYPERVAELEAEGCTTSDAQSIADVEVYKGELEGDAFHAFFMAQREGGAS